MADIAIRVKLDRFHVRHDNESSDDEPYLVPVFVRLDGRMLDPSVPIDERHVPMRMPETTGHADLGPLSKHMNADGRAEVPIPSALGLWDTTLHTENLDAMPAGLRDACQAICFVGFMEEDSTHDSTAKEALTLGFAEARKQADAALRRLLNNPELLTEPIDPNSLIDRQALRDAAESIVPTEIGKAIGKALIPIVDIGFLISAIAQGDVDDQVGEARIGFNFFDLVGNAHARLAFELHSPPTTAEGELDITEGHYWLEGYARRRDADEPPIVAAVRAPGQRIRVFARRTDGDFPAQMRSDDFGVTWSSVPNWAPSPIKLLSGVSAAASSDGSVQWVAGRSASGVALAASKDGGSHWEGWKTIPGSGDFKSTPAVGVSGGGRSVHVIARDADDRYRYTHSDDDGHRWAPWLAIGGGVLKSSPAVAVATVPPRPGFPPARPLIVVAGVGLDDRIWRARFGAGSDPSDAGWGPLRAGNPDSETRGFTSAPALAASRDGKLVLCAARGRDLRYWTAQSFDRGDEFLVGTVWEPLGNPDKGRVRFTDKGERRGDLQRMYSAPALVLGDDGEERRMVGLSPTLGLWVNRHMHHERRSWRSFLTEPEPPLHVHFY